MTVDYRADYTGSWTAWKFFFDAVIRVIKRGVDRPILSFNGRHVEKNIQREEGRNNVQRTYVDVNVDVDVDERIPGRSARLLHKREERRKGEKNPQQPPFHTSESQYVRHKEDFESRYHVS